MRNEEETLPILIERIDKSLDTFPSIQRKLLSMTTQMIKQELLLINSRFTR